MNKTKQDQKLKHMAELQLSVVSESESRRQIGAQIAAWEENLERLHCEQYRLRCYMASLQHGELPNPKVRYTLHPHARAVYTVYVSFCLFFPSRVKSISRLFQRSFSSLVQWLNSKETKDGRAGEWAF